MKLRISLLTIMAVLLICALRSSAEATFTVVSGTMIAAGPPPYFGVVKCNGGAPYSGNQSDPCPGVGGTIRGQVLTLLSFSSDPQTNLLLTTTTTNVNFGADRKGPMWGTYVQQLGGGIVEGTFNGTVDLGTGVFSYKSEGHGRGGTVDGNQFKSEAYPCAAPCAELPLWAQQLGIPAAVWVTRTLDPGK